MIHPITWGEWLFPMSPARLSQWRDTPNDRTIGVYDVLCTACTDRRTVLSSYTHSTDQYVYVSKIKSVKGLIYINDGVITMAQVVIVHRSELPLSFWSQMKYLKKIDSTFFNLAQNVGVNLAIEILLGQGLSLWSQKLLQFISFP